MILSTKPSTDIILINNLTIWNYQCHSLLHLMVNKFNLHILDVDEITKYIENNNNKEKRVIFYNFYFNYEIPIKILKILNSFSNLLCEIVIFTDDIWFQGTNKLYNDVLLRGNKWKIITHMPNYSILSYYAPRPPKNNVDIIYFNYWCCYNNHDRIEFNSSPINKILISGRIWDCYKERFIISKLKNIEILKYFNVATQNGTVYINKNNINKIKKPTTNNKFVKCLHKYIACFTSSFMDTHCILLKFFEILSSGSLLVYPKREEVYLNKIGLKHGLNCLHIDFKQNIQKQINYILSDEKREYINNIRKNGYEYSKIYNNTLLYQKLFL